MFSSSISIGSAIVVVVVDINSPNVGTPRLRVEQIINLTIRTKVLMFNVPSTRTVHYIQCLFTKL